MVVEDDVLMCDELLDMLTKAGYRAVKPDGFDNIIEQILDMAPDILLLDINLPGRSGFDICREIKRRSSVPVLVLTSRDQLRMSSMRWSWVLMNSSRSHAAVSGFWPGWQMCSRGTRADRT